MILIFIGSSLPLIILTFLYYGSEKHVIDICNSVKNIYSDKCEYFGQIAVLGQLQISDFLSEKTRFNMYGDYFKVYGI